MTYLTHISAFAFGFAIAILVLARVSMRPKARKVFKKLGMVKQHKAKVPKITPDGYLDYDEEI